MSRLEPSREHRGNQGEALGSGRVDLQDFEAARVGTSLALFGERALHAPAPRGEGDALPRRRAGGPGLHMGVPGSGRASVRFAPAETAGTPPSLPYGGPP